MHSPVFFKWGIILLFSIRLLHLGPTIDAPQDWRQCDTAYYIRDFYQNGIHLLEPAVCWMGGSDKLALEFPLPEAIVAFFYQVFGESIPLARCVFLLFFAGALYYFYKIADLLFGQSLAQLATLVYMALPLGIFYARAIHIDFSAILMADAMLFYFLKAVQQRKWTYLLLSSICATLAFVIKAPHAFYFALPMLSFAMQQKALVWTIRNSIVYALPVVAFVLWQRHVVELNGASPNLDYILGFRKMLPSAGWYYGTIEQRLTLYSWRVLVQRGVLEVAGIGGIVFVGLGCYRLMRLPNVHFLLIWIIALVGYVLLFFNLNFVHNYYQLPLLAPAAILCARGLQFAARSKPQRLLPLLGILVAANVAYTELFYFKIASENLEIGQLIQQNTPETALVIVTCLEMDCRNPKILYPARRRGWSVQVAALKPIVLDRLQKEEGARFWVYIGKDIPKGGMEDYIRALPQPQIFDLTTIDKKMYLFDLSLKH